MKTRHFLNKRILSKLSDITKKLPNQTLEEIIQAYCFNERHMTFYEEPSETLEYLEKSCNVLENVKKGRSSEINKLLIEEIGKICDKYPEQRFGQIYENYCVGMSSDPLKWLSWCDLEILSR